MLDHPVLSTLKPVIDRATHVSIDEARLLEVAADLAGRDFGWPDFPNLPDAPPEDRADFFFVTAAINFAFTDFATGEIFKVEEAGATRYDADAMVACLCRAYRQDVPILEGRWLQQVTEDQLASIFSGSCPIPMLPQRCRNLRQIGRQLTDRWQGRFHYYLAHHPQRAYAEGEGLLEQLPREFPAFQDDRTYRGQRVLLLKRAQLLLWQLHTHFRGSGFFALEDLDQLTVFADYIVPMALHLLAVLRYSEELDTAIAQRRILPENSPEEVEIRAFSVWACHLMTQQINQRRRLPDRIVEPQLDAYLWFNYHEQPHPHHLTVTTSY